MKRCINCKETTVANHPEISKQEFIGLSSPRSLFFEVILAVAAEAI